MLLALAANHELVPVGSRVRRAGNVGDWKDERPTATRVASVDVPVNILVQ